MNWFFYIVLAIVTYGVLNFLYKLAAQKGLPGAALVNKSAITVVALAAGAAWLLDCSFSNWKQILFFALFNSAFFVLESLSKVKALTFIPTSYYFSLSNFNLIIVLVLSVTVLGERPDVFQWCGIGGIFAVMGLLAIDSQKSKISVLYLKKGLFYLLLAVLGLGLSVFVGKLASTRVDRVVYILFSYILTTVYTFAVSKISQKRREPVDNIKRQYTYAMGCLIGVLNFIGYFCLLKAFSLGPLSLVQSTFSLVMVIPVLLSVLILKEEFSQIKLLMLAVACGAAVLINF